MGGEVFMVVSDPCYSQVMNWIRDIWWRWQSRRWQWSFQLSQAAKLNDREVAYYAGGNGLSEVFARACKVEARKRGIS